VTCSTSQLENAEPVNAETTIIVFDEIVEFQCKKDSEKRTNYTSNAMGMLVLADGAEPIKCDPGKRLRKTDFV